LQALKPKFAVIMAGKNNQYGLPNQTILERLNQIGAKVLRTDQDGTIRFNISATDYSYQTGL